MVKKSLLFLICSAILSFTTIRAFAYNITIKLIIHKDSLFEKTHPVSNSLFGIIKDNWDQIDQESHKELQTVKKLILNQTTEEIAIFKYQVPKDGIYCLKDLFGHDILLSSSMKDATITLQINEIHPTNQKQLYLNDSIQSPWFFKIDFPKKYKFMGFFDSLAYSNGDIRVDFREAYSKSNFSLEAYLAKIQSIYQKRIQFFNNYNLINPIPENLKYFAFKEIQYRFYKDLLSPLETDPKSKNEYPDNLKDTLNKIAENLNDRKLFYEVPLFKEVLLNYTFAGHNGLSIEDEKMPDSLYIALLTNYCKQNLSNESQAYVLTCLMSIASRNSSKNLFTIPYNNYNKQKSTPGLNQLVDSLYNLIVLEKSFTPEELLNLSFENRQLEKQTLKTILGNYSIAVIDCWATWCVPCRKQIPHFEFLANKYKDEVLFIALSADQFTSKWTQWLFKNNDSKVSNYHAENGFNNIFFARQFITAIPRYILISGKGKVLNSSLPFPSDRDAFESVLSGYLVNKTP